MKYAKDFRLQYYRLIRNVLWWYYETIHKLKIDHDKYDKGKDKHSLKTKQSLQPQAS